MNSWTKRAIGVAALAGGLLALGAGTASADEASTRASVRIGSAPTAEVRLCGGGAALSGLLGRCGGQAGSGSDGTTVQAGATNARVIATTNRDLAVEAAPLRQLGLRHSHRSHPRTHAPARVAANGAPASRRSRRS